MDPVVKKFQCVDCLGGIDAFDHEPGIGTIAFGRRAFTRND